MIPKRYSVILANGSAGKRRRLVVSLEAALAAVVLCVGTPVTLLALAYWGSLHEVDRLRLENAQLRVENSSYRAAASQITEQMASLRFAMTELAGRTEGSEAVARRAFRRLPTASTSQIWQSAGIPVERSAFSRLEGLLSSLGNRLALVRRGVAYREALAEATPIMWPTEGWISGTYGYRSDPFTGERDFHAGVDISTRKGQPVYATATGKVFSAGRNGAYGNLVEIDHGFELVTRYGHLAEFAVAVGDTVRRGDVIGYVGATGRATGYHVHYEVWVGDRTVNPMLLYAESTSASPSLAAN